MSTLLSAALSAAQTPPPPEKVGQQFLQRLLETADFLRRNAGNILFNALLILLIFVLARVFLRLFSRCTKYLREKRRGKRGGDAKEKRAETVYTLVHSMVRYLTYFFAILIVLEILGFQNATRNLLVTAGIGSVAIGFGAQSLVKDVITGAFLMFENQFAVGDMIEVGQHRGTVEAIALRVTYLRSYTGEQVIVPNGTISRVINYSRGDALAIVTVPLPFEADTERAIGLIEKAIRTWAKGNSGLVAEEPQVLGVMDYTNRGIEITVTCKTRALKQWAVERGLRLAIKLALDKEAIPLSRLGYSVELVGTPDPGNNPAPESELSLDGTEEP